MVTVRFGDFEWDAAKAAGNLRKHGVSFAEAAEVFDDAAALDQPDIGHPDRFVLLGHSLRARLLLVVYCERHRTRLRIISARPATRHERKSYEDG